MRSITYSRLPDSHNTNRGVKKPHTNRNRNSGFYRLIVNIIADFVLQTKLYYLMILCDFIQHFPRTFHVLIIQIYKWIIQNQK